MSSQPPTSMSINTAAGFSGMLKEGHQYLQGTDCALIRNIHAAKELSRIVSTSLGPNGMHKLVVNHLEKITVTSDCASIVKELEIEHPAARILTLAAKMQDKECGDGTNLVVSFAGELLYQTEELLRNGLHVSEILTGYKLAGKKLESILPTLVCMTLRNDEVNEETLTNAIKPVVGAKHYCSSDLLAPLVARACLITVSSKNSKKSPIIINPECVRVAKILGGDLTQSQVIRGYLALRSVEGSVTSVTNAKITVFGCGIEASSTEAKGTVLMNNAEDLLGYNKSEEVKMEEIIQSISISGSNVIISSGTVSEMAMHFIERYKLMCLKVSSKWELRRLCSATGATALVRLGPALSEEMGHCESVTVQEIGGKHVTIFRHAETHTSRLSTIVLRASTNNVLSDLERAIDDGVHAAKRVCRNGMLVYGAGATEMELSMQIQKYADSRPGLDQYAIRAFGNALQFVPRTLAENSGLDAGVLIASLGALHAEGIKGAGVNVNRLLKEEHLKDLDDKLGIDVETDIFDIMTTKLNAFRLAIDAALTVLKVDQIIMSKPSGGPKMNK